MMIKAIITFVTTLGIEMLVVSCTNPDFGWLIGIPLVGGLVVFFNEKK